MPRGKRTTGQSLRTANAKNVDPAIKNPALRKLIAGRTGDIKPFEWERLGKALDYLLEKVLYENSGYEGVTEWVQRNCTWDERRLYALKLLQEQDYGMPSLQELALLYGKSPEAIRQDVIRLRAKLRTQFPDM